MRDELSRLYEYDELKFRNSAARDLDSMQTHPQIIARLIYAGHALEKSLSNDKFQHGRGLDNIKLLVHLIDVYNHRKYNITHPAYTAAIAALKEFYFLHKETDFLPQLGDIYGDYLDEILRSDATEGGAANIVIATKNGNRHKNFEELAKGRASIRTYADKPVDLSQVREALAIAMRTPTVCNRQSIKVRFIRNKKVAERILKLQGGIIGYETPPLVLLITADDAAYLGANERNQGFVDGGLYAMSTLYALEYVGLAACALNAAFTEDTEKEMRGIAGIPENEKFITFISVGHFKDINNVCKSFRYSIDDILSEIDETYNWSPLQAQTKELHIMSFVNKIRIKLGLRTRARSFFLKFKQTVRLRTRLRRVKRVLNVRRKLIRFRNPEGAIVTLIDYNNYGNIIQRYALQKFLLDTGHAFVSFEHNLPIDNNLEDKRLQYTVDFTRRNIVTRPFSKNDKYLKYIVGSDQVWRDFSYKDIKNQLGFFFLNFTQNQKVSRISYAASFGRNSLEEAKISPDISKYLEPLVKNFDAISVREKTAVAIIDNTWGVTPEVVLDPTMLLESNEYTRLIQDSPLKTDAIDGVFAYLIGVTEENEELLSRAVAYVGRGLFRIDLADYSGPLPPVEQWLRGLKEAELAVVDSFHGAVFSIINNTNFVVLENKGSGMERMVNLLETFGIEEHIIKHSEVRDFSFDNLPPINWTKVNAKLDVLRKKSADWLISALESPRKT